MTRTALSKFVALILIVSAFITVLSLVFNDPKIEVYSYTKLVDVWRAIILAQAGFFLGMNMLCAISIMKFRIDPSDRLLRPVGALLASACILAIYTGVTIFNLIGANFVTWRTPVAFIGFLVGDVALVAVLRRIVRIIRINEGKEAIIKLTFMDTHLPGPDIDMSKEVEHGS